MESASFTTELMLCGIPSCWWRILKSNHVNTGIEGNLDLKYFLSLEDKVADPLWWERSNEISQSPHCWLDIQEFVLCQGISIDLCCWKAVLIAMVIVKSRWREDHVVLSVAMETLFNNQLLKASFLVKIFWLAFMWYTNIFTFS